MVTTCSFAYKILWFKRPINIKTAVGWAESLISYQAAPTGVAIFNVDNDSNIDVVTGENGGGQIHWYERSSSSWIHNILFSIPKGKIDELKIFAFDKNGSQDVFFQIQKSPQNQVIWLENPYKFPLITNTPTPTPSPTIEPTVLPTITPTSTPFPTHFQTPTPTLLTPTPTVFPSPSATPTPTPTTILNSPPFLPTQPLWLVISTTLIMTR